MGSLILRPRAVLFISLLLAAGLVPGAPAEASDAPEPQACAGGTQNVWFVGIVHDDAQRDDFELDVDNFESYKDTLQNTYCFPDSQAKILAFDSGYTRNGVTYDTASEGNLQSTLASFGTAASQHSDSILFFFLASHGLTYPLSGQCPLRTLGSYSALHGSTLYDCELGDALNQNFAPHVRMFVFVDCSFCGGFSDSLTAASGTIPDGRSTVSSGVPASNRIVMTGCAVTTECFGSNGGGVSYKHLSRVLSSPNYYCDGFTVPGFPTFQGVNTPQKFVNTFNPPDGRCSASEWFFAAVWDAYIQFDTIGIQQQFRIKYGFSSLADDILIRA